MFSRFVARSRVLPLRPFVTAAIGTGAASSVYYLYNKYELGNKYALPFTVNALEKPFSPLTSRNDQVVPSTKTEFPTRIEPSNASTTSPLCLVGLGVRTVSFLSIQVYCAGLYLEENFLRKLGSLEGWNNYSTNGFLTSGKNKDEKNPGSEAFFGKLLDEPTNLVIRIVPTRSTDMTHLRDGFVRGVTARLKAAGQLENASESLQQLQAVFPKKSLPKGNCMYLIRDPSGSLVVEYEGKVLGRVEDKLIARELFLAYFANDKPVSAPFKSSVADGFASLLEN